jgi:hypothetical protein
MIDRYDESIIIEIFVKEKHRYIPDYIKTIGKEPSTCPGMIPPRLLLP